MSTTSAATSSLTPHSLPVSCMCLNLTTNPNSEYRRRIATIYRERRHALVRGRIWPEAKLHPKTRINRPKKLHTHSYTQKREPILNCFHREQENIMEDSSSDDSRAAYRVKKSRAKKGQCPHCGIQCYQKRWFGTMKPITRLPDVENGRCLICSQITDSSGTEGDDRETDNGNDSIVRAGEVMRLFTDMITDEDTRYDEYVGTWPGEIQRGSHVQCIGNSLNSPDSVQIGDVGIAASRDLDGTYRVNFPAKDDWCCRPSDLMLDSDAEKIRRGALVRVKSSVIEPQFGWGNLTGLHDTVGFVKRVRYDGIVSVQFGWRNDDDGSVELWMAPMKELEFVDPATQRSDWNGSIQLGDAVRIPSSVDEPSMGWGNLTQGDVGYARAITVKRGRLMYVCDFPSADAWFGTDKDLEKDPHASLIRPGVRVRVKPGIEPKKGWGEVTSSSVGTVVSIDYDGNPVIINFPEQRRWRCFLSEIELFDNAAEGRPT